MLNRLTTWQRFWGLFVIVLFGSTVAVIAAIWPNQDEAIVADLRAPECQELRALPAGTYPEYYPEPGQPCAALRTLLIEQRVNLQSVDDYDGYLFGKGVKLALICLAIWAGFLVGIYLVGWSSGLIVGSVRKARQRKAGDQKASEPKAS